jgi:ATP-dependent DNA helicase RecQ
VGALMATAEPTPAVPSSELHTALRRYWGYSSFRPLQEAVVRSLLAGRDACVVMPTGGGKSLCYQLPAVLGERGGAHGGARGLTLVISPLIALMQDQVAQLEQMGIAAAALHSAVPAGGARGGSDAAAPGAVWRAVCSGQVRLLYLSPERVARPDTIDWLKRAPLARVVIDEAHCISEWGHEFRPEYRQLSALRQHFPHVPIAAFTASATRRVRHDILAQLAMRDPAKFIASFHRPNLRYWVHACSRAKEAEAMLEAALRSSLAAHAGAAAIVYAPTIARVEQTAAQLSTRGIPAIAYHGKMEAQARRATQERWMAGEVAVLVGTVAFGLGINKADVRTVIHLALPKSIEQYYQEAGRAGRDGDPAECVLLWQKRDLGLLAHFTEQIVDPDERERAWQRYHEVKRFAEQPACRHRQVCLHFGERPAWEQCGACDVCGYEPGWRNQPAKAVEPAPRRIRKSSPVAAVSELPALGQEGMRDRLREWRLATARAAKIPAYIVMHDRALDELCRLQPRTLEELLEVPGFGERKVALYGDAILKMVSEHL